MTQPARRKSSPSARAALSRANAMALEEGNSGAIAFSRTGDPMTGEFSDARFCRKFGDTPDDLNLI